MPYTCKGVCQKLPHPSVKREIGFYAAGYKFCDNCGNPGASEGCWIHTEKVRCPCCSKLLRNGPKSRKGKEAPETRLRSDVEKEEKKQKKVKR